MMLANKINKNKQINDKKNTSNNSFHSINTKYKC